jgi:hypothetical protein
VGVGESVAVGAGDGVAVDDISVAVGSAEGVPALWGSPDVLGVPVGIQGNGVGVFLKSVHEPSRRSTLRARTGRNTSKRTDLIDDIFPPSYDRLCSFDAENKSPGTWARSIARSIDRVYPKIRLTGGVQPGPWGSKRGYLSFYVSIMSIALNHLQHIAASLHLSTVYHGLTKCPTAVFGISV